MTKPRGPKVATSHEVDREAKRWVLQRLPASWPPHEPRQGDDYGVDISADIASDGVLTPMSVHIQVKGSLQDRRPTRVRMNSGTLTRLSELSDSTVVIVVHLPTETAWLVPTLDHRVKMALSDVNDDGEVSFPLSAHDICPADALALRLETLALRKRIAREYEHGPIWVRAIGWNASSSCSLRELRRLLPPGVHIDEFPPVAAAHIQLEFHGGARPYGRDPARPTRRLQMLAPEVGGAVEAALQLGISLWDIGLSKFGARTLAKALPMAVNGNFDAFETVLALDSIFGDGSPMGPREPSDTGTLTVPLGALLHFVAMRLGIATVWALLAEADDHNAAWYVEAVFYPYFRREGLGKSDLDRARRRLNLERQQATDWATVARLCRNEADLLVATNKLQALELIRAAVDAHDGYAMHGPYWRDAGGLAYLLGQPKHAATFYALSARLSPDDERTISLATHVWAVLGDWSRILELFKHEELSINSMSFLLQIVAEHWSKPENSMGDVGIVARSLEILKHEQRSEAYIDLASNIGSCPNDANAVWAAADGFIALGRIDIGFICVLTAALLLEDNEHAWLGAFRLYLARKPDSHEDDELIWLAMNDLSARLLGGDVLRELMDEIGVSGTARAPFVAQAQVFDEVKRDTPTEWRLVALEPRPREPSPVILPVGSTSDLLLQLEIVARTTMSSLDLG